MKILFLLILAVGVIGVFTISSQTVFGSQNELIKLLPDGYESYDVEYLSENMIEHINSKLIKNLSFSTFLLD